MQTNPAAFLGGRGRGLQNVPPDISICMFFIDQALSVRALQEMMSHTEEGEEGGSSGGGGGGSSRTLLYGHAVQLRHVQSNMYLCCLSTCSSSDKLSFDVGVHETNEGESCWWTVHPASKQRSEGEKVRVGEDVIFVSIATERYLHMQHTSDGSMVIASFHQTLWNITPVSSGTVRSRNLGYVFGNDVIRLYHGNDECLTIPDNWADHPQQNMVVFEGGQVLHQARSLWRHELIKPKWHGALLAWEQSFRLRHITTGCYLAHRPPSGDTSVLLVPRDKASFEDTAFILLPEKDAKRSGQEEKEEEGMGPPELRFAETQVFIQHYHTQKWISYQTTEVTKKGIGKVEEKKAIAMEEGHMDDCFTFNKAVEEESKAARVVRKCTSVITRFLQGIDALQNEGLPSGMASEERTPAPVSGLRLGLHLLDAGGPGRSPEADGRPDRLLCAARRGLHL